MDTGEAPGRKEPLDSLGRHQGGTSEQERAIWTAREAPGRHQGSIWDSLGGTREVPGRQERTIWDSLGGTREVPERQERTLWTAWEAPGRQERIN